MLKISAVTIAGSLFATSNAMAAAIATSTAEITITYNGAFALFGFGDETTDLTITAQNSVVFTDSNVSSFETPSTGTANVTATADTPAPTVLGVGDSISFSYSIDTSADFRDTQATASAILNALIEVTNSAATAAYGTFFTVESSLLTSANVTSPSLQTGFADVAFFLGTDIGGPAIDREFESDTTASVLTDGYATMSEPFGFNIFAGETYQVTASLSGSAEATSVPLPASILGLAFGLLLLRRQQS